MDLEKILEAASRLGHFLNQNEIVKRHQELSGKLEKDDDTRTLLDEYLEFTALFRQKEQDGKVIEVEEKQRFKELTEKVGANSLIKEFMATQAYYVDILRQVNEAIADPKGEPPKESSIITPDNDKRIII